MAMLGFRLKEIGATIDQALLSRPELECVGEANKKKH